MSVLDPPKERISTGTALLTAVLFIGGLMMRGNLIAGFVVLLVIFVPLEKLFALRPQRVLRPGWATDTVHFFVTNLLITGGFVVGIVPAVVIVRNGGVSPMATAIHAQPFWAQFHQWHHANEPEAINKNFAGGLPLLDLVFRTAYMPKGRFPERFGVDERVPDQGYVKELMWPWRGGADTVSSTPRGGAVR